MYLIHAAVILVMVGQCRPKPNTLCTLPNPEVSDSCVKAAELKEDDIVKCVHHKQNYWMSRVHSGQKDPETLMILACCAHQDILSCGQIIKDSCTEDDMKTMDQMNDYLENCADKSSGVDHDSFSCSRLNLDICSGARRPPISTIFILVLFIYIFCQQNLLDN